MNPELSYYSLAVLLVLVNGTCLFATLFALPGNWMIVGLTALFAWLVPMPDGHGIGWLTLALLLVLAGLAEVLELAASAAGAAKKAQAGEPWLCRWSAR